MLPCITQARQIGCTSRCSETDSIAPGSRLLPQELLPHQPGNRRLCPHVLEADALRSSSSLPGSGSTALPRAAHRCLVQPLLPAPGNSGEKALPQCKSTRRMGRGVGQVFLGWLWLKLVHPHGRVGTKALSSPPRAANPFLPKKLATQFTSVPQLNTGTWKVPAMASNSPNSFIFKLGGGSSGQRTA